jgi:hypothetical protein
MVLRHGEVEDGFGRSMWGSGVHVFVVEGEVGKKLSESGIFL